MTITASRRKFICTEKDRIMFNGACYQLVTQSYYSNWSEVSPVISKSEFNRLLRLGVLSEPYEVKGRFGSLIYYNFKKGTY